MLNLNKDANRKDIVVESIHRVLVKESQTDSLLLIRKKVYFLLYQRFEQ